MSGTTNHKNWLVRICALLNRQENLFKEKTKSRWCYVWLFFIHFENRQKNWKARWGVKQRAGSDCVQNSLAGAPCMMHGAGRRFTWCLCPMWWGSQLIRCHWGRTRHLQTAYLSRRNVTERGKYTAGRTKLDHVAKRCSHMKNRTVNKLESGGKVTERKGGPTENSFSL